MGASTLKMLNQGLVSPTVGAILTYSMYFHGYFIAISSHSYDGYINEKYLNQIFMDAMLGYCWDFQPKWGAIIKTGFSSNELIHYRITGVETTATSESVSSPNANDVFKGALLGVSLNRYIKLRRFNYLAINFDINYRTINYKSVYPEFGKDAFNAALTLAYKGWLTKRINKN